MPSLAEDLAAVFARADLGLQRGVVTLAAPSDAWARTFADARAALATDAPASVVAIEHIGSTSVPGLAAKPIFDIAVGVDPAVKDAGDHGDLDHWLTELGFLFSGDADDVRPDRMYGYELDPMIRLANVHVLPFDSTAWRHYIFFRDFLRGHPSDRDAYQELKARLSRQHPGDRIAYVDGKGAFIAARRNLTD